MRISVELNSFDKGGLEKVAFQTAQEFQKHGHDVYFFIRDNLGYFAARAAEENLKVIKLPNFGKTFFYLRELKKNRIQLSVNHFAYFGLRAANILKIPTVSVIHNNYAFLNRVQQREFKNHDRYVTKYVGVSKLSSSYLIQNFGIAESRIETIPNGLPPKSVDRNPKALESGLPFSLFGGSQRQPLILNVATINMHKGHAYLIRAMQEVIRVRPEAKLLCLGQITDQSLERKLNKEIILRGLQASVFIVGHSPNPSAYFEQADIFVLPSLIEGWSMAMLEAMQHNLPLILSETGGAEEALDAGAVGLMVENATGESSSLTHEKLQAFASDWTANPHMVRELSEAMIDMLENLESWKSRATINSALVSSTYSLEKNAQDYINLFKMIINDRQGKS
jgi:glycosyltransferase involved in cell wall biosynthesis